MNRNVLFLGLASLLNDISSEMISAVLPLFILELGGGGTAIGTIAGLKEAASNLFKILSGHLSDRFNRKKPFVLLGYLTSSTFKLLIGFSKTPWHILTATFLERLGKGIRTSPRDALISLYGKSGKSFGIHRTMDTAGALIGVLLALLLVNLNFSNRALILFAAVISFLALLPLLPVKEPEIATHPRDLTKANNSNAHFAKFLFITTLFGFSNVSFMFLIAIANEEFSRTGAVALYALLNLAYILSAYPSGLLSDKFSPKIVTAVGFILFGVSILLLSTGSSSALLIGVFILYGISLGITDTGQRVLVAEFTRKAKRGIAYGLFHGISGFSILAGNVIAGKLWDSFGNSIFSLFGIVATISGLLLVTVKLKENSP